MVSFGPIGPWLFFLFIYWGMEGGNKIRFACLSRGLSILIRHRSVCKTLSEIKNLSPILSLSHVLNSIFKLRDPRIQRIDLRRFFVQFGLIMIICHGIFERSIDNIFAGPKQFMVILRLAFQDTGKLMDISIINVDLRHRIPFLNKMLFKTCHF